MKNKTPFSNEPIIIIPKDKDQTLAEKKLPLLVLKIKQVLLFLKNISKVYFVLAFFCIFIASSLAWAKPTINWFKTLAWAKPTINWFKTLNEYNVQETNSNGFGKIIDAAFNKAARRTQHSRE